MLNTTSLNSLLRGRFLGNASCTSSSMFLGRPIYVCPNLFRRQDYLYLKYYARAYGYDDVTANVHSVLTLSTRPP